MMKSKLTGPSTCLYGARPTVQSSLTPFLYCTRTLLHRDSYDAERRIASQRGGERSGRSMWARQTIDDGDAQFSASRRSRSNELRLRSRSSPDNEQKHSIPFEGDVMSKLEGTTMTPKEFYKFETLMRKKSKISETTSKSPQMGHKFSGTKSVKPDFPAPLQTLAKEAEQMKQTSRNTQTHVLEVPSQFLTQVKGRMENASNDVELWNILQNEVLNRIHALHDRYSMEQTQELQEASEVDQLIRSAPELLVHFMRLVRTKFQGSSLGPALLPDLKKLGTSAFALLATTELYNEHMHLLYSQYCDLDAIISTLSRMDQEVYEFNEGTQELLASVLKHAHASIRGRNGRGQQALWLTDRKTRSLAKLKRWSQAVDMRMRAAAMKKARDSSADQVAT